MIGSRHTVGMLISVTVAMAACGGSKAAIELTHPPPPPPPSPFRILPKGAPGIEGLIPKTIRLGKDIREATPPEVRAFVSSTVCDSLFIMSTEGRFPDLTDVTESLANSAASEGIAYIPPAVLFRMASAIRTSMAYTLANDENVITQDVVEEAANEIACAFAT